MYLTPVYTVASYNNNDNYLTLLSYGDSRCDFAEEHCAVFAASKDDRFFRGEIDEGYGSFVTGQVSLYKVLEVSTSQIHIILSAPPTATLCMLSSLLHAPLHKVFSNPARVPCMILWIQEDGSENGWSARMVRRRGLVFGRIGRVRGGTSCLGRGMLGCRCGLGGCRPLGLCGSRVHGFSCPMLQYRYSPHLHSNKRS